MEVSKNPGTPEPSIKKWDVQPSSYWGTPNDGNLHMGYDIVLLTWCKFRVKNAISKANFGEPGFPKLALKLAWHANLKADFLGKLFWYANLGPENAKIKMCVSLSG